MGTTAFALLREALWLSILLPAPVLIFSLVVGVAINLLQAVTQVHENTLVFVPKLLATALALVVTGSWMMTLLCNFAKRLLESIPHVVS